jgi:hypothetical protein
MAQRLDPAARDAAVNRVNLITAGVVVLGLAGTVGLGITIASMVPVKPTTEYVQPAAVEAPAVEPDQSPAQAQAPGQAQLPAQTKPQTKPKAQGGVTPKPKAAPKPTKQAPVTTSGGS